MTTEDRAGIGDRELREPRTETEMEIRADRELCIGAGMCTLTAPELFDQDGEDGLVLLLRTRLPRSAPDAEAAHDAAGLCPAEAISIG
ncbi:ferredoxin [Streptomyces sp. NPDC012935]|uniref:ferredoxin n=1 Tax=Streptomyces sp. NPDC012935 TaxID=3364857 RepID=UPI0036944ECF